MNERLEKAKDHLDDYVRTVKIYRNLSKNEIIRVLIEIIKEQLN